MEHVLCAPYTIDVDSLSKEQWWENFVQHQKHTWEALDNRLRVHWPNYLNQQLAIQRARRIRGHCLIFASEADYIAFVLSWS